jgi:hypothetical protein
MLITLKGTHDVSPSFEIFGRYGGGTLFFKTSSQLIYESIFKIENTYTEELTFASQGVAETSLHMYRFGASFVSNPTSSVFASELILTGNETDFELILLNISNLDILSESPNGASPVLK